MEEEEKGMKEPVSDRSKIREIEIFGDCFEFKVKDFLAPKKPLWKFFFSRFCLTVFRFEAGGGQKFY